MVEMIGVEPMTFRVQGGRSASWATPPFKGLELLYGGPKSTRTTDLPVISGVL